MPRPKFTLKTLLWLMAVVAAFFAGAECQSQGVCQAIRRPYGNARFSGTPTKQIKISCFHLTSAGNEVTTTFICPENALKNAPATPLPSPQTITDSSHGPLDCLLHAFGLDRPACCNCRLPAQPAGGCRFVLHQGAPRSSHSCRICSFDFDTSS